MMNDNEKEPAENDSAVSTEEKENGGNNDKKAPYSLKSELFDWLEMLVLSVSVVFLVFTFIVRVSIVDGNSMNNTLYNGEALLLSELFYTPEQGDIVVIQTPKMGYEKPIVKRIIATEGQTVAIDTSSWTVTVDGVALDEPYVLKEAADMRGWDYGESYTVPEGCVFVMGDNRNHSTDSRSSTYVGAVDMRYILGKVTLRFFPINKFGTVK